MNLPVAIERFLMLSAAWLALSGGDRSGWLVGALAASAATALSLHLLPPREHGLRLWPLLRMTPGFLWRSVLGGVDVAWRAVHPRLPLRPGWHEMPTTLPAGGHRVALGAEFSLLPGTLVAGTRGDRLLVHCLDTDQPLQADIDLAEHEIAACTGTRLSPRPAAAGPSRTAPDEAAR
jgi:multicomponent Na+:H+ antiporter subunit E